MLLKTTQFIQAVLFCIIAGQAFFYLIGGADGLKSVSAYTFIEQRKAIDLAISPSLKVIYPLALAVSILMLGLLRHQLNSTLFLLSALACLLLIGDLTLAIKGDIPLNNLIKSWSTTNYPAHWDEVRVKWFLYMTWRQACNIPGLFCVLLGIFSRLP